MYVHNIKYLTVLKNNFFLYFQYSNICVSELGAAPISSDNQDSTVYTYIYIIEVCIFKNHFKFYFIRFIQLNVITRSANVV